MLLRTLSNAACGSFRLALRVKFDEKKDDHSFNRINYYAQLKIFLNSNLIVIYEILIKFYARFQVKSNCNTANILLKVFMEGGEIYLRLGDLKRSEP